MLINLEYKVRLQIKDKSTKRVKLIANNKPVSCSLIEDKVNEVFQMSHYFISDHRTSTVTSFSITHEIYFINTTYEYRIRLGSIIKKSLKQYVNEFRELLVKELNLLIEIIKQEVNAEIFYEIKCEEQGKPLSLKNWKATKILKNRANRLRGKSTKILDTYNCSPLYIP